MKLLKLLVLILVIFLGVSFASLNANQVTINLYIGTYNLHLSLLLLITLGIGMILGFLSMMASYLRLKTENYKIRNKAKWAEKEVSNLRNVPIKDVN